MSALEARRANPVLGASGQSGKGGHCPALLCTEVASAPGLGAVLRDKGRPQYEKDVKLLENVEKRAIRMVWREDIW